MADDMMEPGVRFRGKLAEQALYNSNTDYDEEEKKKHAEEKPESPYNIGNVCWIIAAMIVFYYTDFAPAVLYDPRVRRTWLNIGAIFIGINIAICGFLIIWLSYVRKIAVDQWDQHYPAAIPIATASFTFGTICVLAALWPVWGFLTPVILFVIFMGVVVTIAMLPPF